MEKNKQGGVGGGGLKETWHLLTIFLENDGWILNSKRRAQKEEGRCLMPGTVPAARVWEFC